MKPGKGTVFKPLHLSSVTGKMRTSRRSMLVVFKHFLQRIIRGWSDADLWNLDHRMAKFIYPRLKAYAEHYKNGTFHGSYPGQILFEYKDQLVREGFTWNESSCSFTESDADERICRIWQDILDSMVASMEWALNGEELPDECYRPNPLYDSTAEAFIPIAGEKTVTLNPAYGEKEIDPEAYKKFENRMQNGFVNFGKYFSCLYD